MNTPYYYCLSNEYLLKDSFSIYLLDAENADDAWEEIEDSIATNCSQDWLITREQLEELKKLINSV